MQCPKCGYVRTEQDNQSHPKTECPSCSVIYDRVNLQEKRKVQAERKAQEEQKRKKQFEDNREKRIQQRAVEIHDMQPSQRVRTIMDMDSYDRADFLSAGATVDKLKGMSFMKRQNYLYGGLWNSYRDTMNSRTAQMVMLVSVGLIMVFGLGIFATQTKMFSSGKSTANVSNSGLDGSVSQVKAYLKSNAKDPGSLKFES